MVKGVRFSYLHGVETTSIFANSLPYKETSSPPIMKKNKIKQLHKHWWWGFWSLKPTSNISTIYAFATTQASKYD
jgi:hypothetical protein